MAQYKGLDVIRSENEVCFCHNNVIPIVIGDGILKRSTNILQNTLLGKTNHVTFKNEETVQNEVKFIYI